MSKIDSKDEDISSQQEETCQQQNPACLTLQLLLLNLLLADPSALVEKKKINHKDYRHSRKCEKPHTKQYKEKNKSTHWHSRINISSYQRGERQ